MEKITTGFVVYVYKINRKSSVHSIIVSLQANRIGKKKSMLVTEKITTGFVVYVYKINRKSSVHSNNVSLQANRVEKKAC